MSLSWYVRKGLKMERASHESARLRNCSGQAGAVKYQRCLKLTYSPGTLWKICQQSLGHLRAGKLPEQPCNKIDFTSTLFLVLAGDIRDPRDNSYSKRTLPMTKLRPPTAAWPAKLLLALGSSYPAQLLHCCRKHVTSL